jgi:ubiquinone/menaquinone biosynthesis C-methylase UbiE
LSIPEQILQADAKIHSDIEETYKILAKDYDRVSKRNPAVQADRNIMIPLLAPRKKDLILEIGCRTGRFTLEIAKKCSKIIALTFLPGC